MAIESLWHDTDNCNEKQTNSVSPTSQHKNNNKTLGSHFELMPLGEMLPLGGHFAET